MLNRTLGLAAAAAAAVTLALPPSAAAARTAVQGCTGYQAGGGWFVQCQNGGPPAGSSAGGQRCYWTTNITPYFPGFVQANPPPKGYVYILGPVCPGDPSATAQIAQIYLVRIGGALTTQALAQRAYAELRPPLPTAQTAPPRGSEGLVGLPQWYWVPATQWTPLTRRVAVGPLWAVVTATPHSLTFSPGGGLAAVACPGPGTAYNPRQAAAAQHSACTYTYTQSSDGLPGSAYTASVSITWTATWEGSGNTGGTLPPLTRATTFALPVAEAQALTGTGG